MGTLAYRVRPNEDGSFDIWVASLQVHFPVAGNPSVTQGHWPEGLAEADPQVKVQASEAGTAIGCNGRVVLIKPDGKYVIAPDKSLHGPGPVHWRFRLGRVRD
jgi:hypothetical protein